MTQKDYVRIAQAMNNACPHVADGKSNLDWKARKMQWDHDVTCLADTLQAERAEFDRTRFLRACGYMN